MALAAFVRTGAFLVATFEHEDTFTAMRAPCCDAGDNDEGTGTRCVIFASSAGAGPIVCVVER